MVSTLKKILSVPVIAGVLMLIGVATLAMPTASAASLTDLTLSLSSTVPAATGVTHTFDFTVPTTGTTIKGVRLLYCTSASGTCTTPTGLSVSAVSATVGAQDGTPAATSWTVATSTGQIIVSNATGTNPAVDDDIRITVSGMVNPSGSVPTVFYARITTYDSSSTFDATTDIDGPTQVASAVIPVVTVSGTQDAILELFVVAVTSTSVGDDSDVKDTTATSTATTIPFGTFLPRNTESASSRAVAHKVYVITNGTTGYTATVIGATSTRAMTRTNGLESISDDILYVSANTDWDDDGTSDDTIGFGVNAQDFNNDENVEANEAVFGTIDGDDLEYESIAAAVQISSSSVPTPGTDYETKVTYRVQVDVTQEAGDYSGTIYYTVLPNF